MKKPSPPKLVTITVTTTITIIFWIFFTLYQVLTAKPTPSVDPKLLEPIIPELDSASLQQIRNRVFFEEGSFTFTPQIETQQPIPNDIDQEITQDQEVLLDEEISTITPSPIVESQENITPTP